MADQGEPERRTRNTASEVDRLLAYESIRQLVARYAVAIDSRDIDALVGLFVEDVRTGGLGSGRAALRKSFATSLRAIGVSILNVGTHVIDLANEQEASGIVYCKGEIQDGTRWIHQAIVYDDRYRCVDGSWYFVSRNHRLFYGAEVGGNPLGLPPANWPERHDGWGTVPAAWESWRRFWTHAPDDGRDEPGTEEDPV